MRPMNANMNGSWCPATTHHHQQQQLHHPLKINKDSRIIKKPSSTTSSSSSSSTLAASSPPQPPLTPPKPQQRHPVIIYTHSPKIIHTQPKDFMALVQKLTGMSRTTDQEDDRKKTDKNNNNKNNDNVSTLVSQDRKHCHRSDYVKVARSNNEENESDITTSEDLCSNAGDNGQVNSNSLGPPPAMVFRQDQPHNSFMGNVGLPYFNAGPNSNDLLCCTSNADPTYDFIDFNVPFN